MTKMTILPRRRKQGLGARRLCATLALLSGAAAQALAANGLVANPVHLESVREATAPDLRDEAEHVTEARPLMLEESGDSVTNKDTFDDVLDPIEKEMRFHRAIAESLAGDNEKAMEVLGQPSADDTASLYAAAMWKLENNDIAEGVALLELIASRPDAPPETKKYLAVGYLHLDRAAESEATVDDYLEENDDDSYSHYLRGLALLRQADPARAEDALRNAGYDDSQVAQIQQVVMQFPVDVQQLRSTIPSGQAASLAQARSSRTLDKNYNFTLLFAGEYDSNVRLQPEFSGLGSIADLNDYRFTMASFLDLQLLTCDDFNIGLVGSTFNTWQFDFNEFDIQDYMGGLYTNRVLRKNLIGSLRYEYHHTRVDKQTFANDHRLTPSLTRLGRHGHTTVYYEYNPIDARAPALIPAQLQTSQIHRIGLTQAIYTFGGDGRIYGGYQFANADARGSDFSRHSNMATGRVEIPLPWNSIADLDVRYVWDDYDNPNSLDFFGRARKDERIEVRTGLQKNFVRPVSLRLDYTYINNDSPNVENLFGVQFYDYDRHIFSTQLIFSL